MVLADEQRAALEPLVEACRPRPRRRHATCGARSRRSSGGTRTARPGAAFRAGWTLVDGSAAVHPPVQARRLAALSR